MDRNDFAKRFLEAMGRQPSIHEEGTKEVRVSFAGYGRNPGYYIEGEGLSGSIQIGKGLLDAQGSPRKGDTVRITVKHSEHYGRGVVTSFEILDRGSVE